MEKTISKFLFWTPRIVSILFILFLALFSLDVFDSCNSFLSCALDLFMHNIPVFVLIIVLAISWRYEIVGVAAFALAGLLYIAMILASVFREKFEWYMISNAFIIAGPAFLIAILFWMNWKNKKKK